MTTFGSRLSTCYQSYKKERLLTYGVDSPGQSRGISPLQGGTSEPAPQDGECIGTGTQRNRRSDALITVLGNHEMTT